MPQDPHSLRRSDRMVAPLPHPRRLTPNDMGCLTPNERHPQPRPIPAAASGNATAQAVPHLVNRLVIDTEDAFDTVRRRYESLVPAIDFPGLLEAIATGD